MNAIVWIAQPPEIRPEWQAVLPQRPCIERSQRMRARMNLVEETLEIDGPLSPVQLRKKLDVSGSAMHATALAMEDDDRVRLLRYSVNYQRDAGLLLALPWHTDEEIAEGKAAAEAYARKLRSEAGKRRARLGVEVIQASAIRRVQRRVEREGEVAWIDMVRTTVGDSRTMEAIAKLLMADGQISVQRRTARGGKGRPGRWLVWVGE